MCLEHLTCVHWVFREIQESLNCVFQYFAGNFLKAFRTPPVSPPQHDYLTGLRRVCSMEFRPHPVNSPEGLADPLLSSAAAPSNGELSIIPQSTIYNWSCGHFSMPLLTDSEDNEEVNARREERERIALDCIAKCQRSCMLIDILFCIKLLLLVFLQIYLSFSFVVVAHRGNSSLQDDQPNY